MRGWVLGTALLAVLASIGMARPATAQEIDTFSVPVMVPDSSREKLSDVGVRFHTNHVIVPNPRALSSGYTSYAFGPLGETPHSIRAVYNLPATGGSGVIAIVGAYDYPTALNDFNVFSRQFGLPYET